MQELFIKYLNNDCSPEEVERLLVYFNIPENEERLRILITESLENIDAGEDDSEWKNAANEVFAEIKKDLRPAKEKKIPFFKRRWFQLSAAAIFLLGAFASYYVIKVEDQKPQVEATESTKQYREPGNNKALLTLADGSTVVLENASDGLLTQQGQSKIFKNKDGELSYILSNEKSTGDFLNTIATPKGGQYKATLSDGTIVLLNAASSLRFPAAFTGNERKVELTGEAYFEVAKNVTNPFIVVAGKSQIEVLGTNFNVNSYGDETNVTTTLLEGSVKVSGLITRDVKILTPGQQAQLLDDGRILINKDADTEQAVSWKNGVFNFNNTDLGTVMRQISRWYDVDIKFDGPVAKRKFSGEIQRSLQIPQVLKLLEKNNVFCRLEGKTLTVGQQMVPKE